MRDFIDYGAKQIVIIHLLLYYFDSNIESISLCLVNNVFLFSYCRHKCLKKIILAVFAKNISVSFIRSFWTVLSHYTV